MKKNLHYLIYIVLISFLLISAGPVSIVSGSDDGISSQNLNGGAEKPVVIGFFFNPTCGSCMKVLPFIELYEKSHPETRIEYINVSANPTNIQRFEKLRSLYPQGKIYVPAVLIGNSFLQGEPNITSGFNSAVESFRKNGSSKGPLVDLGTPVTKNPEEVIPTPSVIPSGNNPDIDGIQFFYNPTCGSCMKVLTYLEGYARDHPATRIIFNDISGNRANIEKFETFRSMHPQVTIHVPVVFIGDTLLQDESNITKNFNATVEEYLKKSPSPGALVDRNSPDPVTSINPVVLLVAAIGEGLNPCGLLVLALLLVSLMATGTRKMVLFVGIAYICAFFLVRLLSGFAIFSVIQLPGLASAFTLVAAAIAIIAGAIQIKDGLSKEQKPLLSIPDSKKGLISSYMKKASIPGGFIVGVLVGIYGMACTAGIYISILGMLYKDLTNGLMYLILYNFIVIIPLIAILLLVFFGLPPEKVNSWREERKSQLRLMIGIVMVLMGIIILIPMI